MMAQEIWQPVSKVPEVVRERPKAEEPEEAAFASVNGGRSMFDVLQEEPERARKFGGAMRWYVNLRQCLVCCNDSILYVNEKTMPTLLSHVLEVGRSFQCL